GIQRHRKHGNGARPQNQRPANLSGHRYFPLRPAARRIAAATGGGGEKQSHPSWPRRSQTGGGNPASFDVRKEIPHERRNAQGNSWLILQIAICNLRTRCRNEIATLPSRNSSCAPGNGAR